MSRPAEFRCELPRRTAGFPVTRLGRRGTGLRGSFDPYRPAPLRPGASSLRAGSLRPSRLRGLRRSRERCALPLLSVAARAPSEAGGLPTLRRTELARHRSVCRGPSLAARHTGPAGAVALPWCRGGGGTASQVRAGPGGPQLSGRCAGRLSGVKAIEPAGPDPMGSSGLRGGTWLSRTASTPWLRPCRGLVSSGR